MAAGTAQTKKRGRKQDDSLPPSRSREIQRAFRARRAALLSNLEARVTYLEAEQVELRRRLGLPEDGPGVSGRQLVLTEVEGDYPGADIGKSGGSGTASKRGRSEPEEEEAEEEQQDPGEAQRRDSRGSTWGGADEAMGAAAEVLGELGRVSLPPAQPPYPFSPAGAPLQSTSTLPQPPQPVQQQYQQNPYLPQYPPPSSFAASFPSSLPPNAPQIPSPLNSYPQQFANLYAQAAGLPYPPQQPPNPPFSQPPSFPSFSNAPSPVGQYPNPNPQAQQHRHSLPALGLVTNGSPGASFPYPSPPHPHPQQQQHQQQPGSAAPSPNANLGGFQQQLQPPTQPQSPYGTPSGFHFNQPFAAPASNHASPQSQQGVSPLPHQLQQLSTHPHSPLPDSRRASLHLNSPHAQSPQHLHSPHLPVFAHNNASPTAPSPHNYLFAPSRPGTSAGSPSSFPHPLSTSTSASPASGAPTPTPSAAASANEPDSAQRAFLLRCCGSLPSKGGCCPPPPQEQREKEKYAAFSARLVDGALKAAQVGRLKGASPAANVKGKERAVEGEEEGGDEELCCGGLVDCSDGNVFDSTPSYPGDRTGDSERRPSEASGKGEGDGCCPPSTFSCTPSLLPPKPADGTTEADYLPLPQAYLSLSRYMTSALPPTPSSASSSPASTSEAPSSSSLRQPTPSGIAEMLFDSYLPASATGGDEPPSFCLVAAGPGPGGAKAQLRVHQWRVEMTRAALEIRRLVMEEGCEPGEARRRILGM